MVEVMEMTEAVMVEEDSACFLLHWIRLTLAVLLDWLLELDKAVVEFLFFVHGQVLVQS